MPHALIIGDDEREQIARAVAYAKAHPVSLAVVSKGIDPDKPVAVMKLADRPAGFEREPVLSVTFPGGFRAAFSIEEQPPGFCTHLSIGVEGRAKKGMMPHPLAVQMIAEAFGVPYPAHHAWLEEFEPGEYAVNLVSLYAPTPAGNA
jgi:hypothetical protein